MAKNLNVWYSKHMFFLLVLLVICNVMPMLVLLLSYENIPNYIPAFVNLFGNTVVLMEKSLVSIFRLPLMGLILTIISVLMYSIKLPGENGKLNKMVWLAVAFIGSLKTGLTSMGVLFYGNVETANTFRIVILIFVAIGVAVLACGLVKMHRDKIPLAKYKNSANRHKVKIIGLMCAYVLVALMPFYMR